jgi:hypothetical protein
LNELGTIGSLICHPSKVLEQNFCFKVDDAVERYKDSKLSITGVGDGERKSGTMERGDVCAGDGSIR